MKYLVLLSAIIIGGCAANAKSPITNQSIGESQSIPKDCKIVRVETHPKLKHLHRVYLECPVADKKISA